MKYARLLSPGSIGSMALRNRVVLPAMDQNSCTDDGIITDLNIAHYEERARGGVGLLILETSAVAYPIGATSAHQPSLSHDGVIPGLRRLADTVHAHGSKIVAQICHHGKTALLDTLQDRARLVPSLPLPATDPMGMVHGLTRNEMMQLFTMSGGKRPEYIEATARPRTDTIDVADSASRDGSAHTDVERSSTLEFVIDAFVTAARRVRAAGFDGVEIHAAHGYLISSFLSPAFNHRTDVYGGSAENRGRLLCEIVAGIRDSCGPAFAIIVRLDGREYGIADGITPTDAAETACLAVNAGADAIHVSSTSSSGTGVGFTDGPIPWQPNQYCETAAIVHAALRARGHSTPVIVVGRISPDDAESLLTKGDVGEFVAMGRQLLADPELAARLGEGRPELVRPCINCFVCVAQNFWDAKPVCAVNARLGFYDAPPLAPAASVRHVVVIGGGPGGLEAARVAAARGHRVTLIERNDELGGTARLSALTTPMNGELIRYLEASVRDAGVDIRCGRSLTSDEVEALRPDHVIVATGARRSRPEVSGSDLPHVLTGDDLRAMLGGDSAGEAPSLGFASRLAIGAARRAGLTRDIDRVRSLSRHWLPLGKRIVIIGGGLVGVELAEFLAQRGRVVTVLEEGPVVGIEMAHPRRWRAVHEATAHGVTFVTGAATTSITATVVAAIVDDSPREFPADHVIVASGVESESTFADNLRAYGLPVTVVGDAGEVGYIQGAIRSGHLAAATL